MRSRARWAYSAAVLALVLALAAARAARPAAPGWERPPNDASYDYLLFGAFDIAKNATAGVRVRVARSHQAARGSA